MDGGGQFKYCFLGSAYGGFTIDFYSAGTLTGKNVWVDESKSSAVQQITADANGMAVWYADGDYRMRVSLNGILLWDWPSVKITSDTATMWEGNYGLSYPSASIFNRWQLFVKHDASNNFLELGINEGTVFKRIIDGFPLEIINPKSSKYGAKFDGSTDDTTALQNAINDAATTGQEVYCLGHSKFTKLYFYYDAILNPGFPQTYPGVVRFRGSIAPSKTQLISGDYTRGTILESTDATGPAINLDGTSDGTSIIRALEISNMAIIANNTTRIIDADYAAVFSNLENVVLYQKGTGGGILWEDTYSNTWNNIWIYGAGTLISDVGLTMRNVNTSGGENVLHNINVEEFDKDFEFGHNTYPSGNGIQVYCYNCQAGSSKTYGVMFGHGVRSGVFDGGHIESAFNNGTGMGVLVKNSAKNVSVRDTRIQADIGAQLGLAADVGGEKAHVNTTLESNYITAKKTGIAVYGTGAAYGKYLLRNNIEEHPTPETGTTAIWIEDVVQKALILVDNIIDPNFDTEYANGYRANYERRIENAGNYSYEPILLCPYNTAHTLQMWEQGQHIITNDGATAIRLYTLPPATVGLQFTVMRKSAAFSIHLDPNGTETIRGGGAGKYLSFDTDYTKVILRCVTTGEWEIWYSSGTTSFEA